MSYAYLFIEINIIFEIDVQKLGNKKKQLKKKSLSLFISYQNILLKSITNIIKYHL